MTRIHKLIPTMLAFGLFLVCAGQETSAQTQTQSSSGNNQVITIAQQEYLADNAKRQHFDESINVPKGQEKLALTLTYYNGSDKAPSYTWLRIASSSMNYITEEAFHNKMVSVDVTGELTWGGNQILISGEGPRGAMLGWRLTTAKPAISSVAPATANPGSSIVITGSNLCPDTNGNVVDVNGLPAQCISANADKLIVQVPQNAKGGQNSVHVVTAGLEAGTAKFNIDAMPHLTRLSATWVPPGNTFTIYGEDFSSNLENDTVYIGPLQAQVVNATPTSITVVAPPSYGGYTWGYYQPVKVWINGVKARNQMTISISDG